MNCGVTKLPPGRRSALSLNDGTLVRGLLTVGFRGAPHAVTSNRVVHAHIKSLMPEQPRRDDPVFLGGSSRPNSRFRELCQLAGIEPKTDAETGAERAWMITGN